MNILGKIEVIYTIYMESHAYSMNMTLSNELLQLIL